MHAIVDAASFEGRRKLIAQELGARAIRLNRFDNQPGQEGKEHDERESGQEEIYVPVEGSGFIRIGEEEIPLGPGRFVLVTPDETRQVVAGARGAGLRGRRRRHFRIGADGKDDIVGSHIRNAPRKAFWFAPSRTFGGRSPSFFALPPPTTT